MNPTSSSLLPFSTFTLPCVTEVLCLQLPCVTIFSISQSPVAASTPAPWPFSQHRPSLGRWTAQETVGSGGCGWTKQWPQRYLCPNL